MNKQLFDGGWEFSEGHGMMAMMFAQWQPVTLPHDASIAKPRSADYPTASGGAYAWSGVVTYRKKFAVPADWQDQRVMLEFEGVYMNAEVSINGQLVLLHPYGYTSFVVDLSPYLKYGEQNEVKVAANNAGQPNSRWYSGTGIYRHVWLRVGGAVHLRPWGVFVTTPEVNAASAQIKVDTELSNASGAAAEVVLRTSLVDAGGKRLADVDSSVTIGANQTVTTSQTFPVADPQLWSLESPTLYHITSEVLLESRVVDAEKTSFGIRYFEVDAQQGFRLNGQALKLKGGCVHHDNGLLGAASFDRAEERKIELMKASGFNAIRCAHNPPAPAMLEACDRLGMLVIDETFDCWRMGKNPGDYHLFFEDWWQRDTESMVRRDRNHPSIFAWSIGNEVSERSGVSDGYAWCRRQAGLVRSLDDTRLVTSAVPALFEEFDASQPMPEFTDIFDFLDSAPPEPEKDRWGNVTRAFIQPLDVAGYNYLSKRYEEDGKRFPGRVIFGTETWPHRAFSFWELTERLPYVIGDFVWTSIDYLGESGIGQVTFDQPGQFAAQFPYHLANCGDIDICGFKRPQSYFRDILWGERKEPYIAVLDPQNFSKKISFNPWGWEPVQDSWTYPGSEGMTTRVEVYSADDEVELRLNGHSLGRQPAGAAQKNKAVFEVVYQPGDLQAVAYSGGKETAQFSLHSAAAPAALRLSVDRAELRAEFGDLAYVQVEILDLSGVRYQPGEPPVSFEVSGAGELIAVGAANPVSEELYVGSQRKAFQGRLMAVVRSSGQAGEIHLRASSPGLTPAEITLTVK